LAVETVDAEALQTIAAHLKRAGRIGDVANPP
jgi:hypothetical protein